MAKRRRLGIPDAKSLAELESGFAAKPVLETKSMAPISQIAGEAAALAGLDRQDDRVETAQNKVDADRYKIAEQAGLLAVEIPIDKIDVHFIARDRLVQDVDEMDELKASIMANGLRIPIEVVNLETGYGLISGWRRLAALRALSLEENDLKYGVIKAFVRESDQSAQVYLNMVEENEIRSNLSQYERGRIAVVAVGQGVFIDTRQAINHLFQSASKAKRSKLRSFASIHEALGDLLEFPTSLSEKAGLRLASALRTGKIQDFRSALVENEVDSEAQEWKILESVIANIDTNIKNKKGGRPVERLLMPSISLPQGGDLFGEILVKGCKIEVKNQIVDEKMMNKIMKYIEKIVG